MSKKENDWSVDDGSYFREAREWYSMKYVALISERVVYIVITVLALVLFVLSCMAIYGLLPLTPSAPFTYMAKNGRDTIAHIRLLERKWGEPNDVSLRYYFAEEYVKRREAYSIKTLNSSVLYIYGHSSANVAKEFRGYIDASNPQSPLVLYQSRVERKIDIVSSDITPLGNNKYEARVDFVAMVAKDNGYEQTYHRSKLQFDYTDIHYDYTDEDVIAGKPLKIDPMAFKVTAYSVKQRK
jgi:type IV secretory pathway component VirB8